MTEPSSIIMPDPSPATNERLAYAVVGLKEDLKVTRGEVRGWVDSLQLLHEEKIRGTENKTEAIFNSLEASLKKQTEHLEARLNSNKEYYEIRLSDNHLALQAALASAEKAVNKADIASEKRFESVNEFRAQLSDQVQTFLPRREYEVNHVALDEKLNTLAKTLSDRLDVTSRMYAGSEGKVAGKSETWAIIISVIAVVAAIVAVGLSLSDRANPPSPPPPPISSRT